MSFFSMGSTTQEKMLPETNNLNASKYVLRNYVEDSPEYEKKKKQLTFLFTNYNLKPMGKPFTASQVYYIFDTELKDFVKGLCNGDNENRTSKFQFGERTNPSYEIISWDQPGWYRSGLYPSFSRSKGFYEQYNNGGGKRRKLIRKKSQRRSRQRTQSRSRQRTQRRR